MTKLGVMKNYHFAVVNFIFEVPTWCATIPRGWKLERQISSRTSTTMSLYYEAAAILSNPEKVGGSLKSRIFGRKDLKSSPVNVFALVTETTKWSAVLKEVVERSGLLREERKVPLRTVCLMNFLTLI
jgi:hypothetical protein